jgi:hypothetical protein
MAIRILDTYGKINSPSSANIKVDGKVVHNGILADGILFSFKTDVSKHGKVVVSIELLYGSITITNVRVTYPSNNNGLINMPQPIDQPLQPLLLPLTINNDITYNHYMFNGPEQWIIDESTTENITIINNFYDSVKSKKIKPDWQYNNISVDLNKINDISSLI